MTVRNLTCHTPLSITHGFGGTSDVTFDNCTVNGGWGSGSPLYRPRWWHTAIRIKTDRKTNGTVERVHYKDIIANDVDLVFDIQSWYPCQNQSGMENYMDCRSFFSPIAGVRPHVLNITFENIQADTAWRSVWANCLPESPCFGVDISGIDVGAGTLPGICENVDGLGSDCRPVEPGRNRPGFPKKAD